MSACNQNPSSSRNGKTKGRKMSAPFLYRVSSRKVAISDLQIILRCAPTVPWPQTPKSVTSHCCWGRDDLGIDLPVDCWWIDRFWVNLSYFTNPNFSAIWGWFPLVTMRSQWGRSEVVVFYPDLLAFPRTRPSRRNVWPTLQTGETSGDSRPRSQFYRWWNGVLPSKNGFMATIEKADSWPDSLQITSKKTKWPQ